MAKAPPGYRLSLSENDIDLGRFIAERTSGVHAAADARFEEASRHYRAALAEWRGPLLDDLRAFTSFDAFVTALAEDKLVTEIALAEAEVVCGRAEASIPRLEELALEHTYREPLWAQLISAYYLAGRQSEALDAFRRLRSTLAADLGVEPGRAVRTLHNQVLRQEPLEPEKAARLHADETVVTLHQQTPTGDRYANGAVLRRPGGSTYPLLAMSTSIGRGPDNNIVLADRKVSRHHAAIVDTGSTFVIADLHSANGVYVSGRRIHASATLSSGEAIRIGDQKFIFEATARSDGE